MGFKPRKMKPRPTVLLEMGAVPGPKVRLVAVPRGEPPESMHWKDENGDYISFGSEAVELVVEEEDGWDAMGRVVWAPRDDSTSIQLAHELRIAKKLKPRWWHRYCHWLVGHRD